MSLHIELDQQQHLQISVTGDFSCEISKIIKQRVIAHRLAPCTPIHADLSEVTRSTPSAIARMLLLTEAPNVDFHLNCGNASVTDWYVAALLNN